MTVAATTLKNGVDLQKLTTMVESVTREPWRGRVQFNVHSEWKGGFQGRHRAGEYTVGDTSHHHETEREVTSDEPPQVLGKDEGLSPSDLVLSALAACLTVGYAANAAARGIEIEELRLDLTADGDLQGFMNLNGVRPGLTDIAVKVHLKSNATPDQLQELHDYVNGHSPIWDTFSNPVSVKSQLVIG